MNHLISLARTTFMLLVILSAVGQVVHAQAPAATPKAPAPLTGSWTIDPAHTSIGFTIKHFGISSVPGRFDSFSGSIYADKKHPEKSVVQFTIQTASINTDQPMRDNDIKGKSYFDVADYPTITFQSTKISQTGPGSYLALGDLTMHGITRHISLPFTLEGPILDPFGTSRIGVETSILLSRLDYGIGGNDQLSDGSFAIGKDVAVSISLEATPAKAS
jgi:polyisoprenoid-binding protein YceI